MVTSSSLLAFDEELDMMASALEDSRGARIKCENDGQATHLRLRLNAARRVHRAQNAKIYATDHPLHGRSEYDGLTFRLKTVGGIPYVYLEATPYRKGGLELLSEVEDPDGDPEPEPKPLAEIVASATEQFKKRL